MTPYPLLRLLGIIRDVIMIISGGLTLVSTPPSVAELGVTGAASTFWSAALVVGATVSLIGGLVPGWWPAEVVGCFIVTVGFFVWGWALLFQPDASSVSYALGLALMSASIGQVWRGVAVARGVHGERR